MDWMHVVLIIQLIFGVIIGLYFWNLLKKQRIERISIDQEAKKEMNELAKMRTISLSEPLAEKVRPLHFGEIIGQEEGIRSLRAALCGPNPQHVIIYGPPGVGKTAAARLVLDEAKSNPQSPFANRAPFIELDGTTARFDERGIADPLIGSVHDPIYQGAGVMGQAGIPQPKQGAVTKAHGGILFIDEIGELHSIQLNKLLKVLEDRKVFLESAYYSPENDHIPRHIHDIFQHGLPADFRLVGATTRNPDEIPPAIRSRCLEVFFRSLRPREIITIANKAVRKIQFTAEEGAVEQIAKYATNGREAVNIVQIAAGIAISEQRETVTVADVEWVIYASQLTPRHERYIHTNNAVGLVNGLAVFGPNIGSLLEIEVNVMENNEGGSINITGIAEEESVGTKLRSIRRKSMVKGSIDNVVTVLRHMGIPTEKYDIHVNFPGGEFVDGPSAGIAMATGIYSAIYKKRVHHTVAMTGELGIYGNVKPVGGIVAKIEAAKIAGVKTVIIPRENEQHLLKEISGINIYPVDHFNEVLKLSIEKDEKEHERYAQKIEMRPSIAPV